MYLFKTYKDLDTIEEALQDQLNITKHELYVWYGIDIDELRVKPGSETEFKLGMNTYVTQVDDRIKYINRLSERLSQVQAKKERLMRYVERLESLEYRIAFKRIIEGKTHKQIAEELGYSVSHIQNTWNKIQKDAIRG